MANTLRNEDLSFVDRAPIATREEATLAAPPDRVWPALADAGAWATWFAGTKEARYTSPEPYGLGSTRFMHIASLKVNEEVLAFDENKRFAFRVCDANVPVIAAMVEVITLESTGGSTLVVYRQAVELKPWARLLTPLFRRQLQSSVRQGLVGLADWVSAHPS